MLLVTGGAGYIGSHYVMYERSRGTPLVVLDSLQYGHREAVIDAPLVEGNVGDSDLLRSIFTDYPIDTVVHFAAFASVGESVAYPERYYRNNIGAMLTLLETMVQFGVKNIVFSSTCATYGDPIVVPMAEDHPQAPINPYGESKLVCEKMMAAFDTAHGLKFTALRYFNAAGADPQARIGESHSPETHLIPIILDVALGLRKEIAVFGDDYDTPDGSCIRDYIHINDLASAHSLAAERLHSGGPSRHYNLGTGFGHSVKDVINVCREVTGCDIPVKLQARRTGDPPRLVASAKRAHEELGWQPEFTDLREIVETAWRWHQNKSF